MKRFLTLPSFLLVALSLPASAGTYVVSTLNNFGSGTLSQAIASANADPGSTITFTTSGVITLVSPLPYLSKPVTIDGTTAPGYTSSPVISINFGGYPGFTVAKGADGTVIKGLSLVGAVNSAVTLQASHVTVAGNYIGLNVGGAVNGNQGDGIKILANSKTNVIGNTNAVTGITYMNASDATKFTLQPVSAWQGLRDYTTHDGQYLICGTSGSNGLLYTGPIAGGGTCYPVVYPGTRTASTSVYGPDNVSPFKLRLVGSYKKTNDANFFNHGFYWEGSLDQLPSGGVFRTIDYPGAKAQYVHSTMHDLAVGNADGPRLGAATGAPGSGVAYIYDIKTRTFVTNIAYPGSKTTTAYGIWFNGPTGYTICGGYSPVVKNNLDDPNRPLTQGRAFLVDYDAKTKRFSNWTTFDYPNGPVGVNFISHFEGISSAEPGVYTLNADSVQANSANPVQGSWVTVRRNKDMTFSPAVWVDLNYPGTQGVTSSNSVFGNQVVGLVIGPTPLAYQATINIAFQKSNVISGNHGNGISLNGSTGNVISMNYIGTDANGSTNKTFGNYQNGIFVTGASGSNLIGGQATGANNPTGTKGTTTPVFQRPPQGNLISGNHANGVLINGESAYNTLSGNYIGTDATGTNKLGNYLDGVNIDGADNNSLIGCTFFENPFVFYNVIGGNGGNGVRVNNSDNITVQANFLGMGADNTVTVPNAGDGLLVSGDSQATQVGGVIPLGNVISGNTGNGIEVTDTVAGFISFNTFGGVPAFKTVAAPNGQNGILITSTGGNNTVRTCILSGNRGNGVEVSGDATGVQITDTSCGTTTDINAAIANQANGIVFSGTAHNNTVGGAQPSIEPTVFASGNRGYGIAVLDYAHDNTIVHSCVGIGTMNTIIPNKMGGIYLDQGTYHTTIGGAPVQLQNTISHNDGDGVVIISSQKNGVVGNLIQYNKTGVYADGACNYTVIKTNTITKNTEVNVDLFSATGINYQP